MSEQKPCRSAEDRLVKLGVTVGSHNDEIGIAPNCEIQHSASCVEAFEDMESGLHAIVLEMRHERRPRIEPFPRVNARGWHHDALDHFRVAEARHRVGDGPRAFGTDVPADNKLSRQTLRRPCQTERAWWRAREWQQVK